MASESGSDVPPIEPKQLFLRPGPIPEARMESLFRPRDASIVGRSPQSTTSSSDSTATSCGPNDTSGPCQRSGGSSGNTTMPIILGVVIPLCIAFIVLIFLHRRHVKKLRQEDAADPHKSLDFGMDGRINTGRRRKGRGKGNVPEMSQADARGALHKDRGMSMDLALGNPYLLPPELHSSRESLHSLSRSINTGDDKYRATTFVPDDGSIRSPSSARSHWDNSSTYTASSKWKAGSESTKDLLPSKSSDEPVPQIRKPVPVKKESRLLAPAAQDESRDSYLSTASSNGNVAALRASNNYLGAFISGGQMDEKPKHESTVTVNELEGSPTITRPPVAVTDDSQSRRASGPMAAKNGFNFDIPAGVHELGGSDAPAYYELPAGRNSNIPQVNVTNSEDKIPVRRESSIYDEHPSDLPQNGNGATNHQFAFELPADRDRPTTHPPRQDSQPAIPEIQVDGANEYEDYYEDYEDDAAYDINAYRDALGYDPRMLGMGMRPLPPDDPSENPEDRANRIRSFYKEYFDEAAKPDGGNRASYFDGSENYIDDYYGAYQSQAYNSRGPSMMGKPYGRNRAMSNQSYGRRPPPRAFSSQSGRLPPRQMPKKRLPPPSPLNILPTPHKLQDDSMLPNPIDYAPPQIFKNQRSGTPDSARGGVRPYSPSTRAYNPLVSSFDDLAVLPSPHQLRKSGTFTSLDFAPPRFAGADGGTASETGSIRSNRSGVSALHQHNIRTGAYRVSRIPREVAGTKNELATALRPKWDMNR